MGSFRVPVRLVHPPLQAATNVGGTLPTLYDNMFNTSKQRVTSQMLLHFQTDNPQLSKILDPLNAP